MQSTTRNFSTSDVLVELTKVAKTSNPLLLCIKLFGLLPFLLLRGCIVTTKNQRCEIMRLSGREGVTMNG